MRTFEITPIVKEERTLNIKDFSEYTFRNVNAVVGKTVKGVGFGFENACTLPCRPRKIYRAGEKTVCYCADGKLYSSDGKFNLLSNVSFSRPPEVFSLLFGGKSAIAAALDGYGVIVGDSVAFVNFPKGEDYTVLNGVLCCKDGDKVRFGGAYDYAGYTVCVKESGFVGVVDIGDIVSLRSDGEKLIVFAEKGVCCIRTGGERTDYRVEYISAAVDGIDGKTVSTAGGKQYFIMKGVLYSFDGNLKKIDTPLDKSAYSAVGDGFTVGSRYCVPVTDGDGAFVFAYDTVTGDCFFTSAENKLFANGGFFADTYTRAVGVIAEKSPYECEWQSAVTDFGTDEIKTLYKISLKSEGRLSVVVAGEFGTRTVNADGGYKSVRLNLRGREFSFKISGKGSPFAVEHLKIYYRI